MSDRLPFRQIHLDFHTHESIEGIGADFDPAVFADTLVKARVISINLFARCHHGWMYYDSKAFPERKHPNLKRDLLKEQIEACKARGIRTPVYVTVQWDAQTADAHPEWCCMDANAKIPGRWPNAPGFYTFLCVNTPYRDWLFRHVSDIAAHLNGAGDGYWFDILLPQDCSCTTCRRDMIARGIDVTDAKQRREYYFGVLDRFKRDMTAHVRSLEPDALIFYNAGHVGPKTRSAAEAYTHFELESLPYNWGYTHFPLSVRYARTLGKEVLGMTGKFHTVWGDFHSFKNQAALEFECFSMVANGAKCCVGDQLPPGGKICEHTYNLIGSVYSQIEAREPWLAGATPVTEIALLTPEAFHGTGTHKGISKDIEGAVHIFQELNHQFDIVDTQADFSQYKLLVLVENIPVDDALAKKIKAFVAGGGKVIANDRAGLKPDGSGFAFDLGVIHQGEDEFEVPFLKPAAGIDTGLKPTEYACYSDRGKNKQPQDVEAGDLAHDVRGCRVEAKPGTEVLAEMIAPYFNRTWQHYCSHQHAPSTGKVYAPAVVMTESTGYISHPLFSLYGFNAPQWARQVVKGVVERLLPRPFVTVANAPKSLVATVTRQEHAGRTLLHLLNYIGRRNNHTCDIIEDIIPLHDVRVTLQGGAAVKSIRCVPEGTELPFTQAGGAASFTLPKVGGYQIVEIA
jgi:hypothetical protein